MHGSRKPVSPQEQADIRARLCAEVRQKFFAFRRYMRPTMQWGWWNQIVALELQRFYEDFAAGRRPKLALMAPPQHGKSWTAEDFVCWVAGRNPDLKTIFASYSEELGVRTNINLQRAMQTDRFKEVFGRTRVGEHGWACNTTLIEYADYTGSFRNTTVEGAINGLELHLGVIDDPVKGRAEAMSRTTRDRVWHWFTDDWSSRFAANSAMLIVMTRWHVDDLLGRYMEKFPEVRMVRYPAIAETDEFANPDSLEPTRRKGEPLFEALKPMQFLQERKLLMTAASWESEYQQNPIVVGGGLLPVDKLRVLPMWDRTQIMKSVRYWDKAGTAGGEGAYTAGVLMHMLTSKQFVIEHVRRGRWSVLEREQEIKSAAALDRAVISGPYEVIVEQEPGSGGKESAEATIRNLAGFRVFADRVTGSKEVRAEPFAAQVQGGNVALIAGDWVNAYLDEAEMFPNGKSKDMIDASAGAFSRLTSKPMFNWDAMQ